MAHVEIRRSLVSHFIEYATIAWILERTLTIHPSFSLYNVRYWKISSKAPIQTVDYDLYVQLILCSDPWNRPNWNNTHAILVAQHAASHHL
jgi:hypothetical protein